MKKLENIVFDRICRFLEQHHFKFEIYNNEYIFIYNNIWIRFWQTKRHVLFTHSIKNGFVIDDSIFTLCKFHYEYRNGSKVFVSDQTNALADLWPMLRMIEADSLEEMMIKMDLAGV